MTRDGKPANGRKHDTPQEGIEWVCAVVSTAAVLGLSGYFLLEALTTPSGPVTFYTTVTASYPTGGGTAFVVEIRNLGHEPAADVTVEARAPGHDQPNAITLDYVGPGSTRQVTFGFPGAVASTDDLGLHVTGFTEP